MRLFTGIDVPDDVAFNLERLIDYLRPSAQIRWMPTYNLHVTIKFIGERPDEDIEKIKSALSAIAPPRPFRIEISELGWFPNPSSPRVLWAGVKAGEELERLFHEQERVLEPLGIAREKRPFQPHLTLARIKTPVPLEPLREAIAELKSLHFGCFTARAFHLYSSKLGPAGSIYTRLADFPFRES